MGRKRNQGKARKAAKAKSREEEVVQAAQQGASASDNERQHQLPEAEEQEQESSITNELLFEFGDQVQHIISPPSEIICTHGFTPHSEYEHICVEFIGTFSREFFERSGRNSLAGRLEDAENATLDKFADVWNDYVKMKIVMSLYLFNGTQDVLENNYDNANQHATFARFFEQHIAVVLEQSQALVNWPKVNDIYDADEHTLVKFFRERIPCSCLDEKYEEVKHITKMGFCYNPQCSIPGRSVKRSKAKYCSRCRCVTYCSRECQVADWSSHKPDCDNGAAIITEFEAKQLNM